MFSLSLAFNTVAAVERIMGGGGKDASQIQSEVKEYYGETLATTSDLKTNACCTANAPPKAIRDILAKVPSEVIAKYYGCGSPLPQGIEGLHVLDLAAAPEGIVMSLRNS